MRAFAVFRVPDGVTHQDAPVVEIDGIPVTSQIVNGSAPRFDPADPARARSVLIQVTAFSCNYRDKSLIELLSRSAGNGNRPLLIGSEFAGRVIEVGSQVKEFKPGDRVMGDNHYTGQIVGPDKIRGGVPTNHASLEFQIQHESKLVRIPEGMSDVEAAGFTIGAQTSWSMVRKLDPQPGEQVLVTSATSNTSLFLIGALRQRGVQIFASTRSREFDSRLRALGVDEVLHVGDQEGSFRESSAVTRAATRVGGFYYIFDPYFDLHLERAVALLRPCGRYATCGLLAQTTKAARSVDLRPIDTRIVMYTAIMKNLSIVGNCLGLRSDLETAIREYAEGRYRVTIDSTFTGSQTHDFLARTYNDRRRFGKVIYQYD